MACRLLDSMRLPGVLSIESMGTKLKEMRIKSNLHRTGVTAVLRETIDM